MNKQKTIWYALLAVVFVLPISSFISVRILALAFLLSLFLMPYGREKITSVLLRFWDVIFYLLALTCGLFYSENFDTGLKVLETNFSFLAMAIIFLGVEKLDENKLKQIFYFFSLGLFAASIICLVNGSVQYTQSGNTHVFFSYELTEIINSHPTYLAYYLIFGIIFGLYALDYKESPVRLLLGPLLILFFFLVLLLTGGQTAFISLLLVFSYFILKFFLGDDPRTQKLTIGLVTIMMAGMFLVNSTKSSKGGSELTDSWDRFALWSAAIDANPNVLLGVGTGDSKTVLNEYFRQHNLNEYADDSLNSHNQFIQIYLSNGLIGLLALLLTLARPLYLSFKNNNSFGILVFFPFLIYGMTEVFLGRYQGVVFFALLHQVFVSYYTSSKPAFSLKEA